MASISPRNNNADFELPLPVTDRNNNTRSSNLFENANADQSISGENISFLGSIGRSMRNQLNMAFGVTAQTDPVVEETIQNLKQENTELRAKLESLGDRLDSLETKKGKKSGKVADGDNAVLVTPTYITPPIITTQGRIADWFNKGVQTKATHMLVVCDTYDFEDYPVYVSPDQNPKDVKKQYDNKNMQKIMEIYDLKGDKGAQLSAYRTNVLE